MYLQLSKHKGFQKILMGLYESSRSQDMLLGRYLELTQLLKTLIIAACTPLDIHCGGESFSLMIFSKKQNVLMMLMSSYFPNHLNTGPEALVGKGRDTRTVLYNCRAFCLAFMVGLSRDWWFMQQLQCRPGAEMWGSHPC